MNETERKKMFKAAFDAAAEGYDSPALRFFPASAERLADALGLNGNESVLDVATGTGAAALAIARRVPQGRVTGVDFSEGMLDRAAQKAKALGLGNVEFLRMDMQALDFPDGRFDAASIAFAIFFVEDMERQLKDVAAKVRPGGKVAVSCFKAGSFSPPADLLFARLKKYGVEIPPLTWKRVDSEEKLSALLRSAGLREVTVTLRHAGYYLRDSSEYWDMVRYAGFRGLIDKLAPDDLDNFKSEHLEEAQRLATKEGIWLAVDALIGVGVK